MHPWSNGYDLGLPNRWRRFNSGRMLKNWKIIDGRRKPRPTLVVRRSGVCGCDEYGREAWIMVENDKKSGKIGILSSEEGSAVVYTQKQVKELIETLKKCL